jgi:hypothetical protein
MAKHLARACSFVRSPKLTPAATETIEPSIAARAAVRRSVGERAIVPSPFTGTISFR